MNREAGPFHYGIPSIRVTENGMYTQEIPEVYEPQKPSFLPVTHHSYHYFHFASLLLSAAALQPIHVSLVLVKWNRWQIEGRVVEMEPHSHPCMTLFSVYDTYFLPRLGGCNHI